jgi:hypothetical protein
MARADWVRVGLIASGGYLQVAELVSALEEAPFS